MHNGKKIGVVVPAYNEEKLISKTISTMPNFVDKIIVIDDKSTDKTIEAIEKLQKKYSKKLTLVRHSENKGVGAAIKTGYEKSLELGIDITAVMAGDAQMDPNQLSNLLDPIIKNQADYTKGNRLLSRENKKMPKIRQRGNAILTILTKVASGYWGIMDPQNGYTAATTEVIQFLVNENFFPKYGYCNDILVKLNIHNFRVIDVVMPPIYGEERSGIKLRSYTPKLSLLLTKLFFYRINKKYGGINFHPILLFYYLGLIFTPVGFILGLYILYMRMITGSYTIGSIVLDALFILIGIQFIMFALLFDEMIGRRLIDIKDYKKKEIKGFTKRIKQYWGLDFHPLIFFYTGGIAMLIIGGILSFYILFKRITIGPSSFTFGTLTIIVLFLVLGFQFLLFGRVFELEMEKNIK